MRAVPSARREQTRARWWPHTEALYALTLAYTETSDEKWLVWLERIHECASTPLPSSAAASGVRQRRAQAALGSGTARNSATKGVGARWVAASPVSHALS